MSEAAATLAGDGANPASVDPLTAAPVVDQTTAETPPIDASEVDPLAVVPESAEEYAIQFPDDEDGAKMVADWFKDAGLTKKQASVLVEKRAAAFEAQKSASEAAAKAEEARIASQVKADDSALKAEWGDRYDANIELGRRAVRQFEIPGEVLEAIESKVGYGKMLRMFSRIGQGLGEHTAVGLNGSGGERGVKTVEQRLYPDSK